MASKSGDSAENSANNFGQSVTSSVNNNNKVVGNMISQKFGQENENKVQFNRRVSYTPNKKRFESRHINWADKRDEEYKAFTIAPKPGRLNNNNFVQREVNTANLTHQQLRPFKTDDQPEEVSPDRTISSPYSIVTQTNSDCSSFGETIVNDVIEPTPFLDSGVTSDPSIIAYEAGSNNSMPMTNLVQTQPIVPQVHPGFYASFPPMPYTIFKPAKVPIEQVPVLRMNAPPHSHQVEVGGSMIHSTRPAGNVNFNAQMSCREDGQDLPRKLMFSLRFDFLYNLYTSRRDKLRAQKKGKTG